MAIEAGERRGSNWIQLIILVLLGVVLVMVVMLHLRLHNLLMEKPEEAMRAYVEAPVLDFGVPAKIVSIDGASRTIVMERKRRTGQQYNQSVQVTDETVIRIGGKEAALNDLKEGLNIRLKASMDDAGIIRASQITASPPVQ